MDTSPPPHGHETTQGMISTPNQAFVINLTVRAVVLPQAKARALTRLWSVTLVKAVVLPQSVTSTDCTAGASIGSKALQSHGYGNSLEKIISTLPKALKKSVFRHRKKSLFLKHNEAIFQC